MILGKVLDENVQIYQQSFLSTVLQAYSSLLILGSLSCDDS